MTNDSFIQALRKLIARRGNVRQIHSDNGPNLVGTEQELIHAFNEMGDKKIHGFSSEQQCRLDTKEKKSTSSKPHEWHMGA